MGSDENEKLPPRGRIITVAEHNYPKNITTMVNHLPSLRCGIHVSSQSDVGTLGPLRKGSVEGAVAEFYVNR